VVAPDGTIATLAGTGARGAEGDGGPAPDAELGDLARIQLDVDGDLLVADHSNHRVREIVLAP
jgi:hypothetical protein